MTFKTTVGVGLALGLMAGAAQAQTEIEFWHAMGGQLGESVNRIAENSNASQGDYVITPIFKGSYEETL
ncbi:MAG TPA: ABC transporter substrate-binding protein, partial [Roseibacterium sp.]|nr:ABC transporter substrate-binding protein [Roseibacterium sp.]